MRDLRDEGTPVFVNFTAAWCISCLVNDRVALQQNSVIDAFAQHGIVYLKGDWTNQDREISTKLAEFGRSGRSADIAKADNYVVAALGDLAAGKKIANANTNTNTKPYGCSVKYD